MTDIAKDAPFIRTPYNYDLDFASEESGLYCRDNTLTQQQFKEESDINEIVRKFGLTGEVPAGFKMPTSQDFTNAVTDYHTAANLILAADDEFMTIPPELRARFDNEPQRLIDFIADVNNREEAINLGLIPKPPGEAPPLMVRVVPEVDGTT